MLAMTLDELRNHLQALRQAENDTSFIEAKRAERDVPKSLRETLSAFSNTPGGGVIILGLDEATNFSISGVGDARKLTQDLGALCAQMEPPVRALIESHRLENRSVVTAEIPELDLTRKPCFYPGAGMTNGAFIRVADGDRKLTAYEVQMMIASRGQPREDEAPVPEATVADFEPSLVNVLLGRLRAAESGAFRALQESEALQILKALVRYEKRWVPSIAGLLALGRHPQRFLPSLNATLVVYPTPVVGEPGPNGERFLDNVRIEGPIPLMVKTALAAVQRNMKRRAVIRGLFREDVWEYPVAALREAVVNAFVHRDFSSFARGTPAQIAMFPDRLLIMNPGGLYGPVTLEKLGDPGVSAARNQVLMKLLEDIVTPGDTFAVCENRGSGMGTILVALRQAGMSPPRFDNSISNFGVSFPNHTLLDEETLRWLDKMEAQDLSDSQRMALAMMRQGGELTNASYRQIAALDSRVATKELAALVEKKLVVSSGSGRWTRYRLRGPLATGARTPLRDRERAIVGLLREKSPLSRAEIARALKMKDAVVRHWLRELIARETVQITGGVKKSPRVQYRLTAT